MKQRIHAFSLIEMLVALAILAAATTIAIRAAGGLESQARYQSTTRTLTDVQNAIVGPLNQTNPGGTPAITGFVADVGRLPNFQISTSDPLYNQTDASGNPLGDPLNELLVQPAGVPSFNFQTAASDPGVSLGVGWQGPYIRLPAGPSFMRDGWGNSYHVYDGNGRLVTTAGNPIAQLASWGADKIADANHGGSGDTNGYNADIVLPATGAFASTGTLLGHVNMNVGNDTAGANTGGTSGPNPNQTAWIVKSGAGTSKNVAIWVCYYAPNPAGGISEYPVLVADANATSTQTGYWPTAAASGFQFTIPNTIATIGPRVLRAYVVLDPPSGLSTFSTTAPVSYIAASPPATVCVTGGGQTLATITLPHYSP